jgi:hypothetical protein
MDVKLIRIGDIMEKFFADLHDPYYLLSIVGMGFIIGVASNLVIPLFTKFIGLFSKTMRELRERRSKYYNSQVTWYSTHPEWIPELLLNAIFLQILGLTLFIMQVTFVLVFGVSYLIGRQSDTFQIGSFVTGSVVFSGMLFTFVGKCEQKYSIANEAKKRWKSQVKKE